MSSRVYSSGLSISVAPWLGAAIALFFMGGCASGTIGDGNDDGDPSAIEGQAGQDGDEGPAAGNGADGTAVPGGKQPDGDAVPGMGTDPWDDESWDFDEIPPEFNEDPWQDENTTADALSEAEMGDIEIMRVAIETGLSLGKTAFGDELNRVFTAELDTVTVYVGSLDMPQEDVDRIMEPKREVVCPFLLAPEETPTEPVDCRALTDRAKIATYGQLTNLLVQNPLDDPKFSAKQADNDFWYEQGLMNGIDNETAVAVRQIRAMGLCDRAPEPARSAFEEGVERGRRLYISKLNERLAETGNPMTYPEEVRVMQVCAVNNAMLAPARARALENVVAVVADEPLCGDFSAGNADEISRLNDARTRYSDGMSRGIQTEHRRASEILFRVVPCNVGDPLVIDLDGDGVTLKHVGDGVEFDLFGWGENVKMGWIGPNEAFLALDKNGNGTIDNGRELFVNFLGDKGYDEVATGFENLALYDRADHGGNGDGQIDKRDEMYAHLLVWKDANSDGVSQPSELAPIAVAGMARITLGYQENLRAWPMPHRTRFLRDAESAVEKGEVAGYIHDAWFTHGKARPESE